jgi:hypothetical protein
VVVSARRIVFHLATSYPFQDLYRVVFERVLGIPLQRRVGVG